MGMKWGKRKRQTSDSEESTNAPAAPAAPVRKPRKVAGKTEIDDGKDVSRMSDKDLRERINRINMEQQYEKLTAPSYPPVKNGMDHVNATFNLVNKANQAYQIWNSPVGKLARGLVTTQMNNRRANTRGIGA